MDSFTARRQTVILAVVAIGVSVGILTWSIVTVADLRSNADGARVTSGSATFAAPAWHQQLNEADKSDFAKLAPAGQPDSLADRLSVAVMPSSADMQVLGWKNDGDVLRAKPFPTPAPADAAPPNWQTASLAEPPAASPPAEPVGAATAAVTEPSRPALVRRAEPARGPTPKPHKVATAQRSYTEKSVDQGDSVGVSFRYRRRACTPGNMVDVCYMPAADRQRIVIERW